MGDLTSLILNSMVFVFFSCLLYIFTKHTRNYKRPVKLLRNFALVGVFYSVFVIWHGIISEEQYWLSVITKDLYLSLSGVQTLLFFVFLSSIYPKSIRKASLILISSFFIIQMIGLWSALILARYNYNLEAISIYFLIMRKVGYNGGAFLVYGLFGTSLYWKMYLYSREKRALFLYLGMFLGGVGYLMTLIFGILNIFFLSNEIIVFLNLIGDLLPMIGLLLFSVVYLFDMDYLFRLPINHYFLFIMSNHGMKMYRLNFKTKGKTLEIQENLFAGMISAINSIYTQVLKSSFSIKEISSNDAALQIEKGEYITCIIATDYITPILIDGMKQFVKDFEDKFKNNLQNSPNIMDPFKGADKIFQTIFPFIEIIHDENQNLDKI